jgi:hypothetical protein
MGSGKPDRRNADQIAEEIAHLRDLDASTLRLRWREVTGKPAAPGLKGELLVRALAYAIQEEAFGGLSLAATKRLQAIAAAAGATTAAPHQQQANRERLIKAIVKARAWLDDLSTGRIVSVDGIAMREGKSARNIRMMIQLAFLDPSIIEAVVEGRLPATIGATEIVRDLPMAWTEQRAVLGV